MVSTVTTKPHRMGHETNVAVVYAQSEKSKLSLSVCWLAAHNNTIRLVSHAVGLDDAIDLARIERSVHIWHPLNFQISWLPSPLVHTQNWLIHTISLTSAILYPLSPWVQTLLMEAALGRFINFKELLVLIQPISRLKATYGDSREKWPILHFI